jgi:enoyl-[acyl-carrier protein] reductase I
VAAARARGGGDGGSSSSTSSTGSSGSSSNDGARASPATASIVTLSYLGAQRAAPGYGAQGAAKAALEATARALAADMGPAGVRVNVLSAGPVATLAARALPGFHDMRDAALARSPLRRHTTHADVAGAATFLASELAAGVTGHTLYVDQGVHAML